MTTTNTANTAATTPTRVVLSRQVIKKHTATEQTTTHITVEMYPSRQEIVTVTRGMGLRDGKLVHVATDERRTYGAIRQDQNGYWWLLNQADAGWESFGYFFDSFEELLSTNPWAELLHIYSEQTDDTGPFLPYFIGD